MRRFTLLLSATALLLQVSNSLSLTTRISGNAAATGTSSRPSSSRVQLQAVTADDHSVDPKYEHDVKRRRVLRAAFASAVSVGTLASPGVSLAAEKPPPIIPLQTTARRLRAVPTFTIVDGNGTPFHTYDKDSAGGFGYFFTSYTSALYVLDDAKSAFKRAKDEAAAKKEAGEESSIGGEGGGGDVPDAWGQAQIVTIPLDVALQLSVKKTSSIAQNGKGKTFKTYYQVIPETSDLNTALRMENSPRYKERGRVPLFFVDGLTLPSKEDPDSVSSPVYFRIKDLKEEWQRQFPDKELPKVQVRELNETFRSMIRPGGGDPSVRGLVFVPIPESVDKAKTCGRTYKLGEMILTR